MPNQHESHMKILKNFNVYGPVATNFTCSDTGSWRLERPVVNFENCIKCGNCEKYCPSNIVKVEKDKDACVYIDLGYCKGCGICANECPAKCILMISERSL